jgi:hypothetical protein
MKKHCFLLFTALALANALSAQNFVSAQLLGSRTKAQLVAQFNLPLPLIEYNIKFYRIKYTTPDVKGVPDTVTGLLAFPNDLSKVFPRLVYQHGTSGTRLDVPSYNATKTSGEGSLGLLFAGMGYIAFLPDYLGLGGSSGVHPYVHAKTEAAAAIDMMLAFKEFLAKNPLVNANGQLFITGYSQGGHAAMALHRELELNPRDGLTVTAAAPLSGPYSISGVMRDLILSEKVYFFPAYVPNTIVSYQSAYGNLYAKVSDVFKEPYATTIDKFATGAISLDQLNTQLIAQLKTAEGDSKPVHMFHPEVLESVKTNPEHPFNIALRDNDVYRWSPKKPTRIFYCMADDQVPFMNSVVARDTMTARGAADLTATDVLSTGDHGACFLPALTNTILFFLGFQQIGTTTSAFEISDIPLQVFPNPASGSLFLQNLPEAGLFQIIAQNGKILVSKRINAGDVEIEVADLPQGLYSARLLAEGKYRIGRFLIQR